MALFCFGFFFLSHKIEPFLLFLVTFLRPTMKFLLEQKGKKVDFQLFWVSTGPLGILLPFFAVPVRQGGFLAAFLPLQVCAAISSLSHSPRSG